jgi:aspartate/methionine/tyrosine aminotransferase
VNHLAIQINDNIKKENVHTYEMLSGLGKSAFYPKGILSQTDEANKKAYRFNATIGIATEGIGPMHFDHIQKQFINYEPKDIYPYAPPSGKQSLREVWREKLLEDNSSLQNKNFGLPIVTTALTHGLSIVADLFVDKQDTVILPDKYWGNYNFIFETRREADILTYPLFDKKGKFNVVAFRELLLMQKEKGKVIVLLNFPNNPTGYTPHQEEVEGIISSIYEAAQSGINVVTILDDAYFGLFYEDSVKESLFGQLANLHKRILPIKIDGATKENYVWGLRVGFITYASESLTILDALEQKTKGIIRGTISSSSHLSQTIILNSLQSNDFSTEKQQKYEIMRGRAVKVKEILRKDKYQKHWSYYPFNSGYFMCLKLKHTDAETLRLHLLDKYGVGTIAINSTDLRVAFSCVEEKDIEELFDIIFNGIEDLATTATSSQ